LPGALIDILSGAVTPVSGREASERQASRATPSPLSQADGRLREMKAVKSGLGIILASVRRRVTKAQQWQMYRGVEI
jgi:hypothetical protein